MANVEIDIKGIKCDNPKCDFSDMSVSYEDYNLWVHKPCPKCGDNLLTEEDYKFVHAMIRAADIVNSMDIPEAESKTEFRVNMNGTGSVTFSQIEREENGQN